MGVGTFSCWRAEAHLFDDASPSGFGCSQAPQRFPLLDGIDGFVGGFCNSKRRPVRPLVNVPVRGHSIRGGIARRNVREAQRGVEGKREGHITRCRRHVLMR
ncbi:unnamed protein product [Ectocarpus fasciculatus]